MIRAVRATGTELLSEFEHRPEAATACPPTSELIGRTVRFEYQAAHHHSLKIVEQIFPTVDGLIRPHSRPRNYPSDSITRPMDRKGFFPNLKGFIILLFR